MFNLVLAIETTCGGTSCRERGDEDTRCWGESLELRGPGGGVTGNKGSELALRSFGGDVRCASGNSVNSADGRVGEESREDVGALVGVIDRLVGISLAWMIDDA